MRGTFPTFPPLAAFVCVEPGNATLPIGVLRDAIPENVVPGRTQFPQCLKCRTPQNTIAMPNRSAAAMTSESRTEPPG